MVFIFASGFECHLVKILQCIALIDVMYMVRDCVWDLKRTSVDIKMVYFLSQLCLTLGMPLCSICI